MLEHQLRNALDRVLIYDLIGDLYTAVLIHIPPPDLDVFYIVRDRRKREGRHSVSGSKCLTARNARIVTFDRQIPLLRGIRRSADAQRITALDIPEEPPVSVRSVERITIKLHAFEASAGDGVGIDLAAVCEGDSTGIVELTDDIEDQILRWDRQELFALLVRDILR